MKTIKTAVSLPAETYLKAEKLRKKLGKSRSAMVADALLEMIKGIEIKEAEERDAAAYKAMPETEDEHRGWEKRVAEAWSLGDDWSEEYNATK
jgi:metal-responsive CopG/Arc/MetJ family transcriptional regulator